MDTIFLHGPIISTKSIKQETTFQKKSFCHSVILSFCSYQSKTRIMDNLISLSSVKVIIGHFLSYSNGVDFNQAHQYILLPKF